MAFGLWSASSQCHTGRRPDAETLWGTQGLGVLFPGLFLLWGSLSPLPSRQRRSSSADRSFPVAWSLSRDSEAGRTTHPGTSRSWVQKKCLNEYSLGKWM